MRNLIRMVVLFVAFSVISAGVALAEERPRTMVPVPNSRSVKGWWMERHEAKLKEVQERADEIELIFLGDSITHSWDGRGKEVWDQYYKPRGGLNLGYSADWIERVLWRVQNGEVDGISPKLAVLMIGTNNTGKRKEKVEDVYLGIEAILDELEARLPETKVLLLGIFPRGESPDNKVRQLNRAANERLADLASRDQVIYQDLSDVYVNDDGTLNKDLFTDGIHPNHDGYARWAEAIEPTVEKYVGKLKGGDQAGASDSDAEGAHLFILSGQSNMARLAPGHSFTPAVHEAFGEDRVIVVKEAKGGRPIRQWYKDWQIQGQEDAAKVGVLYDRLMKKVEAAAGDRPFASATFIWMQGERDARYDRPDDYAQALKGLIQQLRDDLGRPDMNVVIGRISDFGNEKKNRPSWNAIRSIQVETAESDPHGAWVDTDDLNGEADKLHYVAESNGYKVLGARFAAEAIALIRRQQ